LLQKPTDPEGLPRSRQDCNTLSLLVSDQTVSDVQITFKSAEYVWIILMFLSLLLLA